MKEGVDARLAATLEVMQRLVQDPDAPHAVAEDARGWLERAGARAPDAEALAGLPSERLLLYRKLVRRGIMGAIRVEIPRTAARLGPLFDEYVDRFVNEELPTSHYLRDVAFEMVRWAAPLWGEDARVPPWIEELARHELLAFEAAGAFQGASSPGCRAGLEGAIAPRATEGGGDLELDRGVAFHPSARVVRYDHAVHELSADENARDEPARRPTVLLAYRDAEHEVRYHDLSPLAAAMIERLLAGETLREAVVRSCEALAQPLTPKVLEGVAELLAGLGARGVVLGAA